MKPDSEVDKINAVAVDISTRREFVKRSMLVCASATLGAKLAAADAAPAETEPAGRSAGAGDAAAPKPAPYPLTPYGSGEPVYLADFDRCQPSSALSRHRLPRHWTLLDFETDIVQGVMLAAGENSGVPDLEFPLRQKGWHAIYFGILSLDNESRLQVRLKNEPVFCVMAPNSMAEDQMLFDDIQWNKHPYSSHGIEEMFWKCADLGGAADAIVLGQLKAQVVPGDPDGVGNMFMPCWLGYIKLVPLAEAEVAKLLADRKRRDTRRLFATDDSFTPTQYWHFQTENDIRRQIEPYRNTDFARLYWEAGVGDITFFPSKVGRLITFDWMPEPYLVGEGLVGQSYRDFQSKGIDPLRVAMDYSHEIGLEFHASFRVEGFHFPPPDNEWTRGGLYDLHPEWRGVDRMGRSTPRLSYAFPGVQQFVISLLVELAGYPLDGVCLLYNRRLPVIEYEAPLVDSFKAKYGLDPRTLDERDRRWQAHRAEVLTGFMRELRARLRAEERRQGRPPVGITAVVLGTREENYDNGLDLGAWVKEGLIDTLVPYIDPLVPYMQGSTSALKRARHHRAPALSWSDPRTADYFIQLTKNTSCRLAPNLMPRSMDPEDYRRIAHGLYQAGVESLYFWDTYMRYTFDPSWSTLRRLGHKQELAEWVAQGSPPAARPVHAVTRLGDWYMSYQTPG